MDKLIKALKDQSFWAGDHGAWAIDMIDCIDIIKDHTAGMVLVPIEPTDEIESAMVDYLVSRHGPDLGHTDVEGLYKAMITTYKEQDNGSN